eukprot:gnl/TRDRNA2_/TRDRNA2_158684_c1_seq1.p1 gnl/TRDRNA2_/TRDRNA2_158684_c1~~gnl/TRDRNA2_/TRDRNA2_158684_c1_seq1.p1  ORF type:complete len:144 (+),score=34.62 gnl/TRDRNA2_/TRDRNA2_158684_c1_seq1:2-433(+)
MEDMPNVKLSDLDAADFDHIMELVDYTHLAKSAEHHRSLEYHFDYFHDFRKTGRMFWTMVSPDLLPKTMEDLDGSPFFYIQLETDKLFYFAMMNQLFTLVSEVAPSNHLHSLLIQKEYLGTLLKQLAHEADDDHGHGHGHIHR